MIGEVIVSIFGVSHRDSGRTRDIGRERASIALCGVAIAAADAPARLECPKCAQIAATVSA